MFKCFLCDKAFHFKNSLLSHLYHIHLPDIANYITGKQCWCREPVVPDWRAFKKHLAANKTTALAHYLSCQLGVEENDGR